MADLALPGCAQLDKRPTNHGIRSVRFAIQAPLTFRIKGEKTWQSGMTRNISNTGLLFETTRRLRPGLQMDLTLTLPVKVHGEDGARMTCHGVVVRCLECGFTAVRIFGCRLRRRK